MIENPCKEIMANPLANVTTRDLMNEVYRRGAIRQISRTVDVDHEMLAVSPNYETQMKISLMKDALLESIPEFENQGVLNMSKVKYPDTHITTFGVDFFICKHPRTLKSDTYHDER
jgi:hypothetical protein